MFCAGAESWKVFVCRTHFLLEFQLGRICQKKVLSFTSQSLILAEPSKVKFHLVLPTSSTILQLDGTSIPNHDQIDAAVFAISLHQTLEFGIFWYKSTHVALTICWAKAGTESWTRETYASCEAGS